jgi:hypothetical protein
MTRTPDWGMIGRSAVLTSLVAAVVLFFALPDQRWISAEARSDEDWEKRPEDVEP